MTPNTTAAEPLLTEAEFLTKYGGEMGVELIDGKVVRQPMPGGPHGYVQTRATLLIGGFVDVHDLGRVMSGDVFVRTKPDHSRLRGADILYIGYSRLPKGERIPEVPPTPELVIEVKSPGNSFQELVAKGDEYLAAGVTVVVILDPKTEAASVSREVGGFPLVLHNGDELTLPDVLPGFAVPVKKFFE